MLNRKTRKDTSGGKLARQSPPCVVHRQLCSYYLMHSLESSRRLLKCGSACV